MLAAGFDPAGKLEQLAQRDVGLARVVPPLGQSVDSQFVEVQPSVRRRRERQGTRETLVPLASSWARSGCPWG